MSEVHQPSAVGSTPGSEPVHESAQITDRPGRRGNREPLHFEPAGVRSETDVANVDFREIVEKVNQFVRNVGTRVTFTFDERSNQPVIIVAENENNRVIRQIPPEEMLDLMAKLEGVAGIIYNAKG